jgi:uncharacterized membrane protein required for colicin V production
MTVILPLLLLVIFAICVAFTLREGMWSNAIRLINIVTAGLIAMNFFEPVAELVEDQFSSMSYFLDFVSLWLLFSVSLLILRLLTDQLISKVKVRFPQSIDHWGGIVFGVLLGWVMVCFTTASLHTAPLARYCVFDGFKLPPDKNLFGLAPDCQWLGFVHYVSEGVYSRELSDNEMSEGKYGPGDVAAFDSAELLGAKPERSFINRYAKRRDEVEDLAKAGSFSVSNPPKR